VNAVRLDNIWIESEWKPTWRKVKSSLQKGLEINRVEIFETKEQQSNYFRRRKMNVTYG